MADEFRPRHVAVAGGVGADAFEQLAFGGVYGWMILRAVAKPAMEEKGPHQAKRSEADERPTPAHVMQREDHYGWRERSAPTAEGPHESLRARTFVKRQPGAERFRQVGKTARLSRAEKQLDRAQ